MIYLQKCWCKLKAQHISQNDWLSVPHWYPFHYDQNDLSSDSKDCRQTPQDLLDFTRHVIPEGKEAYQGIFQAAFLAVQIKQRHLLLYQQIRQSRCPLLSSLFGHLASISHHLGSLVHQPSRLPAKFIRCLEKALRALYIITYHWFHYSEILHSCIAESKQVSRHGIR